MEFEAISVAEDGKARLHSAPFTSLDDTFCATFWLNFFLNANEGAAVSNVISIQVPKPLYV